jgi:hypothetical protein
MNMSEENPSPPDVAPFRIWVDADACPRPVKDVIYKTSRRLSIPVTLVADRIMATPHGFPLVKSISVVQGLDAADDWIAQEVSPDDIVITADIPLAARIVERGAVGIDPRGELYTEANVRERLSVRDFMHELREMGVQTGGHGSYGNKEKQKFANALDRETTRKLRTLDPR